MRSLTNARSNSFRSGLWLVVLALLAAGLSRLHLDVEILNLLPEELHVAQGIKTYQQHFSNARELLITVKTATPDAAESAARSLAQALRAETNLVSGVAWQPMWMENPAQATELLAFLWLNQPPAVFGEWTNRLAATNLANVLDETRARLATSLSPSEIALNSHDPYGLMRLPESASSAAPAMGNGEELFASPDGTFRLLFVEAKPDITGYRDCRSWLASIQRIVANARRASEFPTETQIRFTGRPAFVTEIASGIESDMTGSAGGTLAIIGILFWLTHRRMRPLLLLVAVLLGILAGTTALGGLFLGTVNVISIGFASILLGLAEDFGIVLSRGIAIASGFLGGRDSPSGGAGHFLVGDDNGGRFPDFEFELLARAAPTRLARRDRHHARRRRDAVRFPAGAIKFQAAERLDSLAWRPQGRTISFV